MLEKTTKTGVQGDRLNERTERERTTARRQPDVTSAFRNDSAQANTTDPTLGEELWCVAHPWDSIFVVRCRTTNRTRCHEADHPPDDPFIALTATCWESNLLNRSAVSADPRSGSRRFPVTHFGIVRGPRTPIPKCARMFAMSACTLHRIDQSLFSESITKKDR